MENAEIAKTLETIADLLELQDANFFRIRAYRNAAWTIADHADPLTEMIAKEEDLTELEFVGKDLAGAIKDLVKTGKSETLEELSQEVPLSLLGIKRISGVGPKKARKIWQTLGVVDVDGLEKAAEAGEVATIPGFGEKTQESILRRIRRAREQGRPYGSA